MNVTILHFTHSLHPPFSFSPEQHLQQRSTSLCQHFHASSSPRLPLTLPRHSLLDSPCPQDLQPRQNFYLLCLECPYVRNEVTSSERRVQCRKGISQRFSCGLRGAGRGAELRNSSVEGTELLRDERVVWILKIQVGGCDRISGGGT